jgi:hypothetical protein
MQVFEKKSKLRANQIFLLAIPCVLTLSFFFPVFGQTMPEHEPVSVTTDAWPSKVDSLWTNPTISSPITGYKIEARSDGSYFTVPPHTNVRTFLPWKTLDDLTLHVSIIKQTPLSPDQEESIKKAIVGSGTVKSDDSTTFVSWKEALENKSEYESGILMPTNIVLVSDNDEEANVAIWVTDEKNPIFSGYAANVIEGNTIVKSNIIIYDINSLTGPQISSIVRHEFGHALGLRHSDFAGDLMFGMVPVPSYVTEHHVVTLMSLYGNVINPSKSGIKN